MWFSMARFIAFKSGINKISAPQMHLIKGKLPSRFFGLKCFLFLLELFKINFISHMCFFDVFLSRRHILFRDNELLLVI